MPLTCPLCHSIAPRDYAEDKRRCYYQCGTCHLVFADPASWPDARTEKAEYDLHDNDPEDTGYQSFLARMAIPLNEKLPAGASVLDFGCGPAPVLAQQLEQCGHSVRLFDVFYHPDEQALTTDYDAVVLTEVIEHLHRPFQDMRRLWSCVKPGGILAIMTQRVISQKRFRLWTYKNDPTHVCFYSEATFRWLASHLGAATVQFDDRDRVFLFRPH